MDAPVSTRTFRNGNSEAVRLPRGLGFGVGAAVKVQRRGNEIVIAREDDRDAVRTELAAMIADLRAMGAPSGGIEKRLPVEAPDRPGL